MLGSAEDNNGAHGQSISCYDGGANQPFSKNNNFIIQVPGLIDYTLGN